MQQQNKTAKESPEISDNSEGIIKLETGCSALTVDQQFQICRLRRVITKFRLLNFLYKLQTAEIHSHNTKC